MIAKVCLWMTLAALALLVVIVQTDRQAYRDPAAILLVPGPARVVAGQRLAELTVANGGRGSDLSGTRLLVRWRPIPAHNLLLHAQMAQINGQGDQVVPPLEAAASRGWREPQLQLLVGRSALIERNYVAAAQRLAALLAIGSEGPATSQLAADLLAIPAGRRALISILATPGRYTRPVLRYFAWHKSPALAEDLRAAAGPDGQLPCATVSALAANYRQRGREQLAAGLPATRCPVS